MLDPFLGTCQDDLGSAGGLGVLGPTEVGVAVEAGTGAGVGREAGLEARAGAWTEAAGPKAEHHRGVTPLGPTLCHPRAALRLCQTSLLECQQHCRLSGAGTGGEANLV